MSRFALAEMHQIKGKVKFLKLLIEGRSLFDDFCEMIRREGNLAKQLNNAVSIMDRVANGQLISSDKFKDITPAHDLVKEYEAKTRDLRIYLFRDAGNVVVCGGKKNAQKKDIKNFRSLKYQYLNSK